MKNLSQEPDYKEERHKGCDLPLISSKVQSRTRGENSTHNENSIYCLPSNEAEGDQSTTSKDLIQVPIGTVTRARAKKFKDVLNGLIQELWAQANSWRPIKHDPPGQQRIVTLIQFLEGSSQG